MDIFHNQSSWIQFLVINKHPSKPILNFSVDKSKDHEKQMKTLETEVADKNLEIYNLKRSVSKAETQQEKR